MRDMRINQRTIYYSRKVGEEKIYDDEGRFTGEYRQKYSEPKPYRIFVSGGRGTYMTRPFGEQLRYDRYMSTFDRNCPLQHDDRLWVSSKDTTGKHDYIIKHIVDTNNSLVFDIKKVNVDEGNS